MYPDMSVIGSWKGHAFCLAYTKSFYSNLIKYLMVPDESHSAFIEAKTKCKNDLGHFVIVGLDNL